MVADIRIKTSFHGHRKRRKLKLLLGQDGTGYVLDLWINAALNHPDGVLRGMDHEDIALDAGWDGDARMFTEALLAVAFLDLIDGVYVLHDWAEHQSWVIGEPERVARAKKAITARWEKAKEGHEKDTDAPGHAAHTEGKMPEVGPKNGENVPDEYTENTGRILEVIPKPQSSNTPLLSSPSPKGIKTPPVRANALTSPGGGGKAYSAAFLAWWKAYPLKVKQPRAWDQWKLTKGVDAKTLIEAVLAQAEAGHHTYHNGDKWPHPNKWLKDERWKDEVQHKAKAGSSLDAWAAGDSQTAGETTGGQTQ